MAMNISGAVDTALQAVQQVDQADAIRAKLQIALLKKTLQTQEDQSAELLRIMEGKGGVVDFRA